MIYLSNFTWETYSVEYTEIPSWVLWTKKEFHRAMLYGAIVLAPVIAGFEIKTIVTAHKLGKNISLAYLFLLINVFTISRILSSFRVRFNISFEEATDDYLAKKSLRREGNDDEFEGVSTAKERK